MGEADETQSRVEEDELVESAVLLHVLALHPTHLTVAELVREIARNPAEFSQRDTVERAVRELVGVGILHRNGDFVLPTRATLRLEELLQG
jgi:hypothetical protein